MFGNMNVTAMCSVLCNNCRGYKAAGAAAPPPPPPSDGNSNSNSNSKSKNNGDTGVADEVSVSPS